MEKLTEFIGEIANWRFSGISAGITMILGYACGLANLELLGIIGVLVITDTFSGIMAAYKEKQEITSTKLFGIVTKMVMYFLFLTAVHQASRGIVLISGVDIMTIADLAAAGTCFGIELKSNFENFGRLGFVIPKEINDFINSHLKK